MPDHEQNRSVGNSEGRHKVQRKRERRASRIIRMVLPLAIAALASAAVVLGASYLYTGITLRAPRGQSRSGSRYLASGDYESAIESYREVLADDPDNEEARQNLESAYIEYAESYAGTGDYSNAVIILRQAGTVLSGAENIESTLASIYLEWGNSLSETGDYDTALSVLAAGTSYGDMTSGIRNVYLTWAGNAELAGNFDTAFSIISRGMDAAGGDSSLEQKSLEIQTLQKLYAFSLQTAKLPRVSQSEYEALSALVSDQGGSIVFSDEGMGLYQTDNNLMLYTGAYTDKKRTGQGRWESVNTAAASLAYVCSWEEDVPTGQFSFTAVYDDGSTEAVTGEASEGLFNGTCLVTDRNGVIWDITYKEGIPQSVSDVEAADAESAGASDAADTSNVQNDAAGTEEAADSSADADAQNAAGTQGTDTTGTAGEGAGTQEGTGEGTEDQDSTTQGEIVIAENALNSTGSGVLAISKDAISQTYGIEGYAENLVY